MCSCGCVPKHVRAHIYGSQRSVSQASGICLSLLCSLVLDLHMWASIPGFYMGAGHLNLGQSSALSTEPSPQLFTPEGKGIPGDKASVLRGKVIRKGGGRSHLCVQLIHYEVAECGLEEVILCTVLQQGVIHGVCSHLGGRQQGNVIGQAIHCLLICFPFKKYLSLSYTDIFHAK